MRWFTNVGERSNVPHQTVSSIPEHKGSSDKKPKGDPSINLWRHVQGETVERFEEEAQGGVLFCNLQDLLKLLKEAEDHLQNLAT